MKSEATEVGVVVGIRLIVFILPQKAIPMQGHGMITAQWELLRLRFFLKKYTGQGISNPGLIQRLDAAAPGTGFGQGEHSASERVYDFRPESRPVEKHLLKYEWRETLCRKHIIACDRYPSPRDRNRFWDDDDGQYAPPPPRRDNEYWRR